MDTFRDLIFSSIPVVVEFYADWCSPCKTMSSFLYKVKDMEGDSIRIIKLNVEKNRELAVKYSIQTIPTLMIFKDGKQLWRQSGVMEPNELKKIIDMFK